MNSYRIKEIVCVVLLLVFIFVLTGRRESGADPETVFQKAGDAMNAEGMLPGDNQKIIEAFGIDPKAFAGVYYLSPPDVMDVRELLVVKVGDGDEDALLSAVQTHIDNKINLFEGYAPEQASLLKKYRTKSKKGFVLFVVSEDASNVVKAFGRAV